MNGGHATTMIRTPNELANQHAALEAKQTRRLKVLKSLTIAQLVIGLVVVSLEVFTMLFFHYQTDLMARIGTAILIMIASLLIVCRGKNSTSNCQIVAHLVLAIIIILDEAGLIIKNLTRATTVGFQINGEYYDEIMFWEHYHLTIVVGIMMVLDCVLFMLFIWSSVIASRVSCCCRQQQTQPQMVVLQQGNPTMAGHQQPPMYIMQHPSPNGGMVWQPVQGGMMVQPSMVPTNVPAPIVQPIVPGQAKETEAMQSSNRQSTSASNPLPDTSDLPTYEQSTAVPMETTDPTARLLIEEE